MKHEWVMDFADLVLGHAEEKGEDMSTDLAYQLGCAYFDWSDDFDGPQETIHEAFERYLTIDGLIKR